MIVAPAYAMLALSYLVILCYLVENENNYKNLYNKQNHSFTDVYGDPTPCHLNCIALRWRKPFTRFALRS